MSSYGDGNTYRGTSCKDSEVPTYRLCTPEEELELSRAVERDLRERIHGLESKLSDLVAYCKDGYGDHEADEVINAEKLLEQPR